jgi:hypothetical protein
VVRTNIAIDDKLSQRGISVIDQTEDVAETNLYGPHVYFTLQNGEFDGKQRIKIGYTGKSDGSRHETESKTEVERM